MDSLLKMEIFLAKPTNRLEKSMTEPSRQHYRKILATKGMIFLAGKEQAIRVKNLSIIGFLAELAANNTLKSTAELFQAIRLSALVDFYLPQMSLAGEAEIVRSEQIDDQILLGLEFKNLEYNINNQLYKKRQAYRKNFYESGHIDFNGKQYEFSTQDVSVDGLMIKLSARVAADIGIVTPFEFKKIDLAGQIKLIWLEYDQEGGTLMGLQYVRMEKTTNNIIPQVLET